MRRSDGQKRLEEIGNSRDEALRGYAALAPDLEKAGAAALKEKSWQLEAAEAFVDLLLTAARERLDPQVSASMRDLLEQALIEGPAALQDLQEVLAERLLQAQEPEEALRALHARRRCAELRLRCLDHLAAVFDTPRSQP